MKLAPITAIMVTAENYSNRTKAKKLFELYLKFLQEQKKVVMWTATSKSGDVLYTIILWKDNHIINQVRVAERLAFLLSYDNIIDRQPACVNVSLRVDEYNSYMASINKTTGKVKPIKYTGIDRTLADKDAQKALADMVINLI